MIPSPRSSDDIQATAQEAAAHEVDGAGPGARVPGRGARTRKQQFPLFWIALGAVVVIAGIAAVVASASGNDTKGGSNGAATSHEFGTVTVTGTPLPRLGDSGSDPAIGETIPTVKGESFAGTPVTIAPDGQAQLIVFLAHWCPHCNREAPKLAAYLSQHGGTPAGVDAHDRPHRLQRAGAELAAVAVGEGHGAGRRAHTRRRPERHGRQRVRIERLSVHRRRRQERQGGRPAQRRAGRRLLRGGVQHALAAGSGYPA